MEMERALQFEQFASEVFRDVEGAFEKAKVKTISNILRECGTDLQIIRWVKSSLIKGKKSKRGDGLSSFASEGR